MDTLFADISEWQPPLDDSYPYEVLSIRSNDGTYRDMHFTANFTVAQRWLDSGRLKILVVYFVVRPNWQDSLSIHIDLQGSDRPDVVSMVDAESWGGQITGDHSHAFNSAVWGASDWHGSHINGWPPSGHWLPESERSQHLAHTSPPSGGSSPRTVDSHGFPGTPWICQQTCSHISTPTVPDSAAGCPRGTPLCGAT